MELITCSETSLQSLTTVGFSIKGWATSLHNRLQCHPCAKPHQLIMVNACHTSSLHSNNTYWIHSFSHKPQNKILSTQCASVLICNLYFIGEGILMNNFPSRYSFWKLYGSYLSTGFARSYNFWIYKTKYAHSTDEILLLFSKRHNARCCSLRGYNTTALDANGLATQLQHYAANHLQ